jgi:hypothetical protein
VTQWIDDYAMRLSEIAEPEWLRMIENPESRWFKGKPEYQNLFKLGKRGQNNEWQS